MSNKKAISHRRVRPTNPAKQAKTEKSIQLPRSTKSKPISVPKPKPVSAPAVPATSAPKTDAKPDYNDPEHIKSMLEGYATIPLSEYNNINPGDHIRYMDPAGNFRSGGYVWFQKINDEGRKFWMIGQTRTAPRDFSGSKRFVLYWDKVGKLFKKMGAETDLLRQSIDAKQDYISDMALFLLYKFGDEFRDFMNSRESSRMQ
jgi:hypothetical protein